MNEKKLQKILREFALKREWEQFHNLKNLAISINIETSELLEIFQWKNDVEIESDLKKKKSKKKYLMKSLI
jgi:NTP pyrophosphatase (non-canonical NTP hydrolase)